MKNRLLSAKILSLLLVILLVSCGSPAESPSGADTAKDAAADAAVDVEEAPDIYADLPKSDFGGYEFKILNNISNFAMTTMFAEELNGEPVNDAIYNRNALVEQELNIKFTEQMQEWNEVTATMQKLISAGDPVYDAFWNESKFQTPFAVEGQLVPIGAAYQHIN